MVDQLVETWRINNRANLLLLNAISDEALHDSIFEKGKESPAKQFAHMHNVRFWKLEKLDKALVNGQSKISRSDDILHELLRIKLLKSADAVATILKDGFDNDGVIEGFRRGASALLGYLISHESHHRGNMMLIMRQCGYKLPKSVTYGLWDWNKI